MELLASRANGTVKNYCKLLASGTERARQGLFCVQTEKLLLEAARYGGGLHSFFYTRKAAASKPETTDRLRQAAQRSYEISEPVADKLNALSSTDGLYGLAFLREQPFTAGDIRPEGNYLLCDGIRDPGNLGTIIRTASAFLPSAVLLSPDCCDRFSMKVVRASMGGVFRVPLFTVSLPETLPLLRAAGIACYSAELAEQAVPADSLRTAAPGRGVAVVVGNESGGVRPEVSAQCENRLLIPMAPQCESLNAGVAASILLGEMMHRG